MALSVTITKKSVQLIQEKLYHVTINMKITDGTTEVLNQDFSVKYRTGESIAIKQNELIAQCQAAINKYKAELQIYNAASFTTMCNNIQTGLSL